MYECTVLVYKIVVITYAIITVSVGVEHYCSDNYMHVVVVVGAVLLDMNERAAVTLKVMGCMCSSANDAFMMLKANTTMAIYYSVGEYMQTRLTMTKMDYKSEAMNLIAHLKNKHNNMITKGIEYLLKHGIMGCECPSATMKFKELSEMINNTMATMEITEYLANITKAMNMTKMMMMMRMDSMSMVNVTMVEDAVRFICSVLMKYNINFDVYKIRYMLKDIMEKKMECGKQKHMMEGFKCDMALMEAQKGSASEVTAYKTYQCQKHMLLQMKHKSNMTDMGMGMSMGTMMMMSQMKNMSNMSESDMKSKADMYFNQYKMMVANKTRAEKIKELLGSCLKTMYPGK